MNREYGIIVHVSEFLSITSIGHVTVKYITTA